MNVAPLVGAWIEIAGAWKVKTSGLVAPLVGAWIEIPLAKIDTTLVGSRSPCGSVD